MTKEQNEIALLQDRNRRLLAENVALAIENERLREGIATIDSYMHGAYPGDQIADTKTLCKQLLNQ